MGVAIEVQSKTEAKIRTARLIFNDRIAAANLYLTRLEGIGSKTPFRPLSRDHQARYERAFRAAERSDGRRIIGEKLAKKLKPPVRLVFFE